MGETMQNEQELAEQFADICYEMGFINPSAAVIMELAAFAVVATGVNYRRVAATGESATIQDMIDLAARFLNLCDGIQIDWNDPATWGASYAEVTQLFRNATVQ